MCVCVCVWLCGCRVLQAFADTFDLEGLTSDLHSHVPFPVLLIKLIAEFLAKVRAHTIAASWASSSQLTPASSQGNTLPKSFKEGKAFKAL